MVVMDIFVSLKSRISHESKTFARKDFWPFLLTNHQWIFQNCWKSLRFELFLCPVSCGWAGMCVSASAGLCGWSLISSVRLWRSEQSAHVDTVLMPSLLCPPNGVLIGMWPRGSRSLRWKLLICWYFKEASLQSESLFQLRAQTFHEDSFLGAEASESLKLLPKYSCESHHFRHSCRPTLTPCALTQPSCTVKGCIDPSGISARRWNTSVCVAGCQPRSSRATRWQHQQRPVCVCVTWFSISPALQELCTVLYSSSRTALYLSPLKLCNGLFCALFISVT